PFGGLTAILMAGDRSLERQVSTSGQRRSQSISNYATFSLVAGAASAYALGRLTHNEHLRETGVLSGEAIVNDILITSALRRALGRERPFDGDGKGAFFRGGTSFPSQHAAIAWSVASIVAHEYPGPLTKFLAYGLASSVTVTRVSGKQHFASDVFVGSALGWYLGRQVYRARHEASLGGTSWGDLDTNEAIEQSPRSPERMGSDYVALDSWVYPAIERLAALGHIQSAFLGLKPWTRIECARLVEQSLEATPSTDGIESTEAELQARLRREFFSEFELFRGERNRTARMDSVYMRTVSLNGPPLTDSVHFGQTIAYDFGRPFRMGINAQVGASFRAAMGPAAVFVRAEFQHSPPGPPLSDRVRDFIATADRVSTPAATAFAAINRPRLLDAYVAINLREGWQFAFGKQSLSWGPGRGGSFLFSDNIEPIPMLRLSQSATHLPGLLQVLGLVRVESFIGRLEGHTYIPHPYVYGNKINFKPLPNLELGFGRTVTIGGKGGDPLTAKNFCRLARSEVGSWFVQRN
ncbi:MAG TPA: capsule assembly Wzi family protein, partial [Terriglobales bacterium]|nr:capsule assembly Wzi family protein [Terriglobales bacterium]